MRASDAWFGRTQSLVERMASAESLVATAAVAASSLCLVVGCFVLANNGADVLSEPALGLVVLALGGLAAQGRSRNGTWSRQTVTIAGIAAASLVFLLLMPEWFYGYEINAIIHHSFFSAGALLTVGTLALSESLYHFLGATPSARDVSIYPLLLLPVCLALLAYGMILGRIVTEGAGGLSFDSLTTAYTTSTVNGAIVQEAGMRNHILGTLLLIVMTLVIAVPIGVGTGVYMSEYPGWTARIMGFSATMLRSISIFIIGATALNLVQAVNTQPAGDPLTDLIRGYYHDDAGFIRSANGSFLLASCFLAVLVIPVIARAAEEGLRSVPLEVREGTMSLGATDGHSLRILYLPWAFPIILTGVLVAAAEAAGSTAVLLFISGTGEHGVGPLKETVSLDFLIFQTRYGPDVFVDQMRQYQYTAALVLLMITLSLTAAALVLKSRARRRYIGIYSS